MTNEEFYKQNKIQNVLELVEQYNETNEEKISTENFDLQASLCQAKRCAKCGKCCKRFPCVFSPNDFLNVNHLRYMREVLNTGVVCISKTPDLTYILRARGVRDKYYYSPKWEYNPCALLSKTGCLLSPTYRPMEGLLYVPTKNEEHQILYTHEAYEEEWEEYHDALMTLFQEYKEKTLPPLKPADKHAKVYMKKVSHLPHAL